MKTFRGRGAVVVQANIFDFAASGSGHVFEQEAIHGTADTESEDACVLVLLHLSDDLHIVADETVSHETDDAHVRLILRRFERGFDRAHHLGASVPGGRRKKLLRPPYAPFGRPYRLIAQYARV